MFRHMKDSDPLPSDEETAHTLKYSPSLHIRSSTSQPRRVDHTSIACRWLTVKRPRYFSTAQVQNQSPLSSPSFSFADLVDAAPHLVATVQCNAAISMASGSLLKKVSDANSHPNAASKSFGGNAGSARANRSKSHKEQRWFNRTNDSPLWVKPFRSDVIGQRKLMRFFWGRTQLGAHDICHVSHGDRSN